MTPSTRTHVCGSIACTRNGSGLVCSGSGVDLVAAERDAVELAHAPRLTP
jgi:hypothetical protein